MKTLLTIAIACVLVVSGAPLLAQDGAKETPPATSNAKIHVGQSIQHDTSPPLAELIRMRADAAPDPRFRGPSAVEIENRLPDEVLGRGTGEVQFGGPDAQLTAGPATVPATIASFDSYSNADNAAVVGGQVLPPDNDGDIGPDHFITYVNLGWVIQDRTGAIVPGGGPFAGNTFWAGFGGNCETLNAGDPIVHYDQFADRWMFSQFIGNQPTGLQCWAVSTTSDPMGPYHRYAFAYPGEFNDYPKIGVWVDEPAAEGATSAQSAYTMTSNDFAGGLAGATISVVERDAMLVGDPAEFIRFTEPFDGTTFFFSIEAANIEGPNRVPAGTCPWFIQAFDTDNHGTGAGSDGYQFWELCADWDTPASSVLTGPTLVASSAGFTSILCGFSRDCLDQPGTTTGLDPSSFWTMFPASTRYFPDSGDILMTLTHNVAANGPATVAAPRWAQFDVTSGTPTLVQDGVYMPDTPTGQSRWMGSIAMDAVGNIGLVYTSTSSTVSPEIRYTGREAGDPLGTLQADALCQAGGGSQLSAANRWGDYSFISLDPLDDCTFWMVHQYNTATGGAPWATHVCSFQFPSCIAAGALFFDGFESGDTTGWAVTSP